MTRGFVVPTAYRHGMLIDCDKCEVRGSACAGCVVSVMLGAPPDGVELDAAERRALEVLADAGMVPRLRLITGAASRGGGRPRPGRAA